MKRFIALLSVSALVASTAALGGCSSSKAKAAGGYAKQLNFYQWTEYTPKSTLEGFEKKYGITVNMSLFSSNEEMIAKLSAGGLSDYDVTVPSNYVVKAMIAQNLLEPIDKSAIPNLKNLDPAVLGRDYDPSNTYTVPYLMSPCVLAVNTKKVKKDIKSYNDLLDPSLKNQIVVVDDERPIIGAALLALGYSLNDVNSSDLAKASDWLDKLRPNIKVFDSDSPKTELITGECSVGLIYNGEAALAISQNPDIKIIWPKEGISGLTIDNLAVVKGTKHEKEANLFINYILDPTVSAGISEAYPYTNPNDAAHALLPKSYIDNAASNIPFSIIKKSELLDDVGDALTQYDRIYTQFKG